MKKSLLAIIIAASLAMTGCEDKETTQKLQNAEQSLVKLGDELKTAKADLEKNAAELSTLAVLKAENETLKADLAKAQQHSALQVEMVKIFDKSEVVKHKANPKEEFSIEESKVGSFVSIPKTNLDWLNKILVAKAYGYNEETDRKIKNPTEKDLLQAVETTYQDMLESVKQEPVYGYDEDIHSTYFGQRNNIATFTMMFYSYGGGAHGNHHTSYINVDLDKKSEITLNDLISPKNHAELKAVLWESYAAFRNDENGKYNGFADPKEFRISEDFYFSPYGITFVYPPYELGAYAEGDVEVGVDWYQINHLLNKDYQRTEKDGFYPNQEE